MDLYGEHADLYAAAFSWDVCDEVRKILDLSGGMPRRVLEPMCGQGRLLAEFGRRGCELVGIDASEGMLNLAARRLAPFRFTPIRGSVVDTVLDEPCDLAACPINSAAYLSPVQLAQHLAATARNLRPGSSYWIQLDLRTPERLPAPPSQNWEFTFDGRPMRCEWFGESFDGEWEVEVSRFTCATTGTVLEARHRMKVWTWPRWSSLIEDSPFTQIAAFTSAFESLPVDDGLQDVPLTWHQLVRR
jgi:SAM-dependent methyltransferase